MLKFVAVERKAEVGDTIQIVWSVDSDWLVGATGVCTRNDEFDDWSIDVNSDTGLVFIDWENVQYVVLEPINSNDEVKE